MPIFPFLFTVFNVIKVALTKYEEGEINTNEKWVFITRFCFLSEDGQFEYSIQYDQSYAPINLLLYYDDEKQWPSVYKSNKSCPQRESVLSRPRNQIITLTDADFGSGCTEVRTKRNSTKLMQCHQGRRFHSSRERWWFLAVSNCNSTKGLSLRYRFLMTNGPPGDYWHEHFSADEFYILPVLMSYCIVYMLLVLAVIMCAMELRSRQLYHTTYKLFAVSVYLQELGVFVQGIAYVRYAVDGIGVPRLRNVGRVCESASEVVFLLLLLLLAKGYTITRGRLRLSSSVKLTIFMCVYVIMYITLFIYEKLFFDPGEVLYLYESPAGYGLVILRILAWWMFIYSTVFTLKHYPEKSSFYYPFNLVGTMWFVAGPSFILAANTMIDKWVRESVVCAVQHFITLAGHILFLVLTVPNKANKNFPYHVRTTQIGIMEVTNGIAGNNTLDHFGHHPYAPGGPTFPENFQRVPTELFTIPTPLASTHGPRWKFSNGIENRSFTPDNIVTRPEEIVATSSQPGVHPPNNIVPKPKMKPIHENNNSIENREFTPENMDTVLEETEETPSKRTALTSNSDLPKAKIQPLQILNGLEAGSSILDNTLIKSEEVDRPPSIHTVQTPNSDLPKAKIQPLQIIKGLEARSSNLDNTLVKPEEVNRTPSKHRAVTSNSNLPKLKIQSLQILNGLEPRSSTLENTLIESEVNRTQSKPEASTPTNIPEKAVAFPLHDYTNVYL